jgi:sugar phosphate isomerase/epimerase
VKLAFSSLACPTWALDEIVERAAAFGYAGVELRGLLGQNDLTLVPELSDDAEGVKGRFAQRGVELICLGTTAHFAAPKAGERKANLELARRHIELAARLGCPMVRVSSGDAPWGTAAAVAMMRAGEALAQLGRFAADHGVTVVVENEGELGRSENLWFLLDAADHPAVRCCWNPVQGLCTGDRPTISVPRLSKRLHLVHLCDAKVNSDGRVESYVRPGAGQVEFERLVTLLRGIGYEGYLVFEWPKLLVKDLPQPEEVLPQFKSFVTEIIEAEPVVLSAYKGDKRAVKFRRATGS